MLHENESEDVGTTKSCEGEEMKKKTLEKCGGHIDHVRKAEKWNVLANGGGEERKLYSDCCEFGNEE
ncbi:hypothetical protein GCK72_005435 [Caenorhabditis remanei]|uniref:Uncharacterized protein n=1 Tax=Caenorhabditis remanei TaxID=31234 RepID=A0A6A5HGK0_CAERE|nr:hypothetical protein GCK72_005435 [Caenorhabditis remanei]KAF1765483.1 hypothetical protein GCK72_005435 [Caenorhabditis remanei]